MTPQETEMICQMSAILMQPLMTATYEQNSKYVDCVVKTAVAIYTKIEAETKTL